MQSLKAAASLLAAASLCAASATPAAARRQEARAPAADARGVAAGPHAAWSEVRVEFEGNRLFTSERLRRLTTECYERSDVDGQEFDPEVLDHCLRVEVLGFMRRSGYVRARLGELRTERTRTGETVTVPLEENELYRLGEVRIEGAEFFPAARLRELLPVRRGDVADGVAVVRWLNEHLKKLYADEGFIQYEYDVEPAFDLDTSTGEGVADLSVTINEGRRFRLRRLTFAAGADAPEEAIRGALGLKEGGAFSAREFREAVEGLNDLEAFGEGGRFEYVNADRDAEFLTDEETAELEVRVHLTERGRGRPEPRATQPDAAEGEGRPGRPSLQVRKPQTREE